MTPHRIGIVGLGKIARDQHVPALRANPAFELVAAASPRASDDDGIARVFNDHREMLKMADLDAVAICTPPQVRHAIARDALRAGKSVLLEKPPTATVSELLDLERLATQAGRVLFTAWHSQHNDGVEAARKALAGAEVARLTVTWKEDVRRWHPGQAWIWQPGGFGVFDPGMNALSILSRILPEAIFIKSAGLEVPSNAEMPIAASVAFSSSNAEEGLHGTFDWRHASEETWTIAVETRDGRALLLSRGGSRLEVDGRVTVEAPHAEYPRIYARFDELLKAGRSEVDAAPLRLLADIFLVASRTQTEAFES